MGKSHVSLPEAFFVLSHLRDGKRVIQRKALRVGLAGAVLTALVTQRRVSLVGDRVVHDDAADAPVGVLGEFDAMVRSEARPRSAKHWVRKFRDCGVEGRVAVRAVQEGLVTADEHAVLGFVPIVRYVPNPAVLDDLTARVGDVLACHREVTEWDASLVGLCDAAGVLKRVLPATRASAVRAITEGAWASETVRNVIKQSNAAVRSAVIATVNANNGSQGF